MIAENVVNEDTEMEVQIEADYADETVAETQYTISGYGADFDVEGLVRRLDRGDIEIPEFQRTYVWNRKRASRFVESLLMGLPVPGIFLYRDKGSQTLRVIDGQQRLISLQAYYSGNFPDSNQKFKLAGLNSRFEGLAYVDLSGQDRRRLNDSIIHASIIQQESPDDDGTSQFALFERLNTTSTPLSPQEIRAAIYGGELNEFLVELNECAEWRALVGKPNRRKRDQELILRFIALYFSFDQYQPPMKSFLNQYMNDNRDMRFCDELNVRNVFQNTVSVILEKLGEKAFKPSRALNAAVQDSLMIGIARRLDKGPIDSEIMEEYDSLMQNEEFGDLIYSQTSHLENVRRRIQLATEAFSAVE
ncbi:MAG: DUF262 domain-containing protein [Chloroflexota bacterium]|nr:DUF262 domain-containing protein [Chloroflexota bacterium]MDE2946068.1 DUF262 domain-containing protein [Chloroflexota bacterium]